MTGLEMGTVIAWAAAEGWNPGLCDGELFRGLDPDGFLVAIEAGAPVGAVSVARYGDRFAFLGLYLVRPDRRGRGLGLALWRAGLAHAGGRTVGLDGVVAQQDNYRRSGFAAAHRCIRFSGTPAVDVQGACVSGWAAGRDAADVLAFDARHHPEPRPAFAAAWLAAPGHQVRVARLAGRVAGYGVARPARTGFRVGPLLAETPDIAAALLAALANACGPGPGVAIDIPEPNAAGLRLAEGLGLRPVFETARMYRGPAPDLALDRIFGLASLEVG